MTRNSAKRKAPAATDAGTEYNSFDNSKATYFEAGLVDEDADVMGKIGRFFGGGKK